MQGVRGDRVMQGVDSLREMGVAMPVAAMSTSDAIRGVIQGVRG